MNYQCNAYNCLSNTVAYCLSHFIPTAFCLTHSLEHQQFNRDHRIFDIISKPLSEVHENLLKISQFKISLKNTKKSLLSESFKLAKLVNKLNQTCVNHINEIIKNCDERILRISSQDEVVLKLSSDQSINSLKEWNNKMISNYSQLQSLIKETLDISKFSLSNSIENEITFFGDNTKKLFSLNLDSFKVQGTNQNSLPEDIRARITICELPNKSHFCYGNWPSGLTFLIDQDKNIKLLPNGKPNHVLDSKYYNNFVYAIGGEEKLAEKYNLLENKWESCASIPYNYHFAYSRSSLLGSKIVIVAYYFGKVISYDSIRNNYQELTGINLGVDVDKFTFTGRNRIYIGEHQKKVYESGENDLTRWTCISTSNPVTDYQISYYSLVNESVFFFNNNLYEFKLRTKEINIKSYYSW